jgi:hypothetical protein
MIPDPKNSNAAETDLPKVEITGDDDLGDDVPVPQCRLDDPDCESCQ